MTHKDIESARSKRAAELKQKRLSTKIKISEFAAISGLNRVTIIRIESGRISWNVDSEIIYVATLDKITVAMSVPVESANVGIVNNML